MSLSLFVCAGGDVSLPKGEADGQPDHGAAAVSGVLPEERSRGRPSGHGGLHPRTHTQGRGLAHLTHAPLELHVVTMVYL